MRTEEQAWCTYEWVKGRSQTQIANGLGLSAGPVCSAIAEFCRKAGLPVQSERDTEYGYYSHGYYGDDRREIAKKALDRYSGPFIQPEHFDFRIDALREQASLEHAWLLRAEGLTYRAIGNRLGVSQERARQKIWKFGRIMQAAIRRPRAMEQVARALKQHPVPAPPPLKTSEKKVGKLTIEFELSEDAAVLNGRKLSIDLGSGLQLIIDAPRGIERINSCVMQIVMDVEGPVAQSQQTPVERLHETPADGGPQIRQDGGPGEFGAGGIQTENP